MSEGGGFWGFMTTVAERVLSPVTLVIILAGIAVIVGAASLPDVVTWFNSLLDHAHIGKIG